MVNLTVFLLRQENVPCRVVGTTLSIENDLSTALNVTSGCLILKQKLFAQHLFDGSELAVAAQEYLYSLASEEVEVYRCSQGIGIQGTLSINPCLFREGVEFCRQELSQGRKRSRFFKDVHARHPADQSQLSQLRLSASSVTFSNLTVETLTVDEKSTLCVESLEVVKQLTLAEGARLLIANLSEWSEKAFGHLAEPCSLVKKEDRLFHLVEGPWTWSVTAHDDTPVVAHDDASVTRSPSQVSQK